MQEAEQSLIVSNGNGHAYTPDAIERGKLPQGTPVRYTGEVLLRTRPKTYRKVVELLANPEWSKDAIAKSCKVSKHSINAIEERELATIETRKSELTRMFTDLAHVGVARTLDTIGKAKCRDAGIVSGIAVDKILALTNTAPLTTGVIVMPSDQDREERRAIDAKLNAIAERLNANRPALPER